jgi:hypothetical protein
LAGCATVTRELIGRSKVGSTCRFQGSSDVNSDGNGIEGRPPVWPVANFEPIHYSFFDRIRFGLSRSRSRTPGPPPFSLMNTIPLRSRALRRAPIASFETSRRVRSKSTTVDRPRCAARARSGCVMLRIARAPRHCDGVIESPFSIDMKCVRMYKHIMLIAARQNRKPDQHDLATGGRDAK